MAMYILYLYPTRTNHRSLVMVSFPVTDILVRVLTEPFEVHLIMPGLFIRLPAEFI
jgi:hypothetical protein